MREGDYGLFVALSDYTKNVKNIQKVCWIIKSINGSELADLILKYYDYISDNFKSVMKLKRVFILIIEENEGISQ